MAKRSAKVRAPIDYRHAIYAGSFDPVTLGHTSIIERAATIYERVTVAIGVNPKKSGLFTREERQALIEASVRRPNVDAVFFDGLLVDFAHRSGAGVILRGLRLLTDFEHEFQLALANRRLAPELETVFLLTESQHLHISSSLAKEIAENRGDFTDLVPPPVVKALLEKFPRR